MFSKKFNIDKSIIEGYGAVDISLIADIPLFVDPILIFNSDKKEYQQLHKEIVKYFNFLAELSNDELSNEEINTYFTFKEVYNNWFGYSMKGNKGSALNDKFAKHLYKNIKNIVNTNNISTDIHIEKSLLFYDGSGKDKISDMTVNLIKGFLCEYTQTFSQRYLSERSKIFAVEKAGFNYKTRTFISKEYFLPFIINDKGKEEYILLTPKDILRYEEPEINNNDFMNDFNVIRNSIDNYSLKTQLNNYISKCVREYIDKNKKKSKRKNFNTEKIEKSAFYEFAKSEPIIGDYYIKIKEEQKKSIIFQKCSNEVQREINKYDFNSTILANKIDQDYKNKSNSSLDEAVSRLKFFKNEIENNYFSKLFYDKDDGTKIICLEKELQRMFKLAWYQSKFKVDPETNNGSGQADFVISYGSNDSTIIEFKLASNNKLKNIFKQMEAYQKSNNTINGVYAIFYYNEIEYDKTLKIIKENNKLEELDKTVFLIDCRIKNSASKLK